MFKKGQIFNFAKIKDRKRNNFDLSYSSALTCKMGDLIPIMNMEVVAGDKFKFNTDMLIRFNPLVAPIYQSIDAYTHFFFIPYRILWDNWENFITGGKDNNKNYSKPFVYVDPAVGTLGDYLGLPTNGHTMSVDAAPFKAYQLIYNEYYRDQNLSDEINILTNLNGAIPNELTEPLLTLRKRAWEHDYFTSCLPFAQKGKSVSLPGGTSDIVADGDLRLMPFNDTILHENQQGYIYGTDGTKQYAGGLKIGNTTSPTINDFRRALAVQKYQELLARAGSRYTEWLKAFFGTSPADARLQRPEYLGGGKQPVYVQEVLQMSETATTALGTFAGKATSAGSSHIVTKEFTEPGILMGIMSVIPHTAYYQGVPKQWTKFDRFDHYTPQFEHIGEQPVLNYEVYYQGDSAADSQVFGYLPRYAEYKFSNDEIHGQFRDTLKYWTLARGFSTLPTLSKEFVECSPSNEIFAMPDEQNLLVQLHHNILAKRKMSVYSTPNI
ncbi:major capsid protein [Microvirus sp.]|nr:major capsid protein [Microvirus sp.]